MGTGRIDGVRAPGELMRVGIIGLGYRLGYLAHVFNLMVKDFEVAGYVDPAPAGRAYAQERGVDLGKAYDTPEALLEAEDIDLLMVGSPNHMHLDHIKTGLAYGRKIFAEKPVVTTIEETIELAELIGRHPADQIMVGLVLRYAPLYVDLRRAQAEGLLGDIVSI